MGKAASSARGEKVQNRGGGGRGGVEVVGRDDGVDSTTRTMMVVVVVIPTCAERRQRSIAMVNMDCSSTNHNDNENNIHAGRARR